MKIIDAFYGVNVRKPDGTNELYKHRNELYESIGVTDKGLQSDIDRELFAWGYAKLCINGGEIYELSVVDD